MGLLEVVIGVGVVCYLTYYYLTAKYNFWKDRGIKGPKPIPFFGNASPVFWGKISIGRFMQILYNQYRNEKVIGIFMGRRPVLVLRDPEICKTVLIKDFAIFADRGVPSNEKVDPLSMNLFALDPKRWKPLRVRLTPIFTTGKLKDMCILIKECADHLEKYLGTLTQKNNIIDVRALTAKYTTDVIGSCAFGVDMQSLQNENSDFQQLSRKVFAPNPLSRRGIRAKLRQLSPALANFFAFALADKTVETFFIKLTKDAIEYREKHNIVRHDLINVLMDLKRNADILHKDGLNLSDGMLAAQSATFFLAGFETSSTAMTNALYELAFNQKIQDKLREEIRQGNRTSNGELRYETVKEMQYLDCVFREILRRYPPGQMILRRSVAPYHFKEINIDLPKNHDVWISIAGIHNDPDIYPNPEIFDPERFSAERENTRHSMAFLPFGDGPRNCIGERFAVYQTKIGLCKILNNFKVEPCEKTMIPYVADPRAVVFTPKGGVILKITKLEA